MNKESEKLIEEFMKDHKPFNPIFQYQEELEKLKSLGFSLRQMKIYLKEKRGVSTTIKTIKKVLDVDCNSKGVQSKEQQNEKEKDVTTSNDFFKSN